jgi:hypothetical protein
MLALVSMALPSAALEQREFHSQDKTKSFYGRLMEYSTSSKTVTVRLKNGKTQRFKISLLSEEDQKYVLDNLDTLAVMRSVSVKFKEITEKPVRTKEGRIRTSTTPTYFDLTVYNRSKTSIENLELRYNYYYCVGSLDPQGAKHTPKVLKGTLQFDKIFGQDTITMPTAVVKIVRASKKGVAPPVPSGGC